MISLHQLKIRFILNRKPITEIRNLFLAKRIIDVRSEYHKQHTHKVYAITALFFKVKLSAIFTVVAKYCA
jgi:hypothetical protein